jgi:hypothetical protein
MTRDFRVPPSGPLTRYSAGPDRSLLLLHRRRTSADPMSRWCTPYDQRVLRIGRGANEDHLSLFTTSVSRVTQLEDEAFESVRLSRGTGAIILRVTYAVPNPVLSKLRSKRCMVARNIIPDDANHDDPEHIIRLADLLPGSIRRIAPSIEDTRSNEVYLDRLERALHIIERTLDRRTMSIDITPDGKLTIEGHVFLHLSKLSDEVAELLRRHRMMMEKWDDVSPGHIVVPQPVSDLILGYLANHISRRTGYDTVTDQPLTFAVNSLDRLRVSPRGDVPGVLLAAILKVQIPREIGTLDGEVYLELRERYAPLRREFRRVTASLADREALASIEDPDQLRARIIDVVTSFAAECEMLRGDRWMDRFREYAPLAVSMLISVFAAIFDAGAIAVGSALAGSGITVIQNKIMRDAFTLEEKTQRLLADLRAEILQKSLITGLI